MVPIISIESLCLHRKFGHCKFSERCRKYHAQETCESSNCEVKDCLKRHPKACSFSHKKKEFVPNQLVPIDHVLRLDILEKKIEERDNEINSLNDKVDALEETCRALKIQFRKDLETVTALAVKEGTNALINAFNQKQDDLEKKSATSYDALYQQLTLISNILPRGLPQQQPYGYQEPENQSAVPTTPESQSNQASQCQKHQCELCGKSFGSDRALKAHLRNNHKPK